MMLDSVLQFFGGFVFAIILARTPLIVLPRLTALQNNLAPFPNPQPVDEQLLSQMLVLRTIWNLSFLFALLPLAFGYLILSTFAAPIAFGLFIGGGWSILSRLMPSDGLSIPNTPYPYELIHELNELRVEESSCCSGPDIVWEVTAVRCSNCRKTHLSKSRPDLGRRRSDGLVGKIRLLMLDGHPIVTTESED